MHQGIAYVHAEFAAVLSSVFMEPGDQLVPGHLLQSLDLKHTETWALKLQCFF